MPNQLEELTHRVALVESDMIAIRSQHSEFKVKLDENTRTTNDIKKDTESMIEMFRSWQGAFKTLEMIGKLFKPLTFIAAVIASVATTWAVLKGGISPK